jgi:hypothetical protein
LKVPIASYQQFCAFVNPDEQEFILKVNDQLIPVKASLKEEWDGLDFSNHGEVAQDIA